eukprot:1235971-Lingulodinium_polyedra.AAC.1
MVCVGRGRPVPHRLQSAFGEGLLLTGGFVPGTCLILRLKVGGEQIRQTPAVLPGLRRGRR